MDRKEIEYQNKIANLEAMVNDQRNIIAKQKAIIDEFKSKEQSISSAIIASIEHANQLEASRKKLYSLDIQRSRLMYLRMEQIINELYARYPELTKDGKLRDMRDKFKTLVYEGLNDKTDTVLPDLNKRQTVVDDPIKKLLHNIIDCFDSKKAGGDIKRGGPSDVLINNITSSGFDFNEALHPNMPLEEIMKAFNLGNKKEEE